MIHPIEFANRRRYAVEQIAARKLDAFVVSALPNVRYLSGFTGSNAMLVLPRAGEPILLTDPRYDIQSRAETQCAVRIARGPLHAALLKLLPRKKWKRIGFERNRLGYAAYAELSESLPLGRTLEAVSGLVEELRAVKSPAETELIRRSVRLNSEAFTRAVRRFKAGMPESVLAAELEYQMRKLGAERAAFETIVASAERSALPHAQPTAEAVVTNRLLLIDMGAVDSGYASDMTRMLHPGKPGAKAKNLYRAVLQAQLAAIDAVREGVKSSAVDRAARAVLRRHGMDRLFVHSTGHGLGLEIHEPPRLGKRDATPLRAGMVVTIEPGAYIEGFGGVRIEDTILVTRNGCEILTPTSKELMVL